MGTFGQTISAILARLAQMLGIRPTEQKRVELMKHKLFSARATNTDRLEDLKDKIRQLEAHALRKKHEYEAAKGDSRRIVAGEIERLFRDLDRLHGEEKVLSSNIERISLALAKIDEYEATQVRGATESELDDIALGLQEAFDELRVADRAARDLEGVKYQEPQVSPVNTEERLAEVTGESPTATTLSPETARRLKQLETE